LIGPTATVANGLSTSICVAGEAQAARLLAVCPGTRAMLTRLDGTSVTLG
jgi:FAD:protein FMN transferase